MVVLFSREECLSAAPGARRVRGRLYLPTNPQRQALPTAPARPHQRRHPRSTQAQSDRGRVCGRREGGSYEQMFGAKEQVPHGRQTKHDRVSGVKHDRVAPGPTSPILGEDENKIERVQRGEIYAYIVGCNHRDDNSRSCRHKRLCCRTGPREQWDKRASCGKQCVDNATWLRRRQQAWLGWRKRG